MLVEVPFAYDVEVVPLGRRKPIPRRALDSIVVELNEVEPDDMPLAFRVSPRWEPSFDIHWHHGSLWRRMEIPDGGVEAAILAGQVDILASGQKINRHGNPPVQGDWDSLLRPVDFREMKSVNSVDKISRVHEVTRAAALVLVCGDALWSVCEEPRWVCARDVSACTQPGISWHFVLGEFCTRFGGVAVYRADQKDAARRHVAANTEVALDSVRTEGDIEVFMPQAVRLRPDLDALSCSAIDIMRTFVPRFYVSHLPEISDADLIACLSLLCREMPRDGAPNRLESDALERTFRTAKPFFFGMAFTMFDSLEQPKTTFSGKPALLADAIEDCANHLLSLSGIESHVQNRRFSAADTIASALESVSRWRNEERRLAPSMPVSVI